VTSWGREEQEKERGVGKEWDGKWEGKRRERGGRGSEGKGWSGPWKV